MQDKDEDVTPHTGMVLSPGLPSGMLVFTFGPEVVGAAYNGLITGDPVQADTVHFAAVDYPGGEEQLRAKLSTLGWEFMGSA